MTVLSALARRGRATPDRAVRAAAEFLLGKDPTRLSLQYLELPHDSTAVNARDWVRWSPCDQLITTPLSTRLKWPLPIWWASSRRADPPAIGRCRARPRAGSLLVGSPAARGAGARSARGTAAGLWGHQDQVRAEDPNVERVQAIYEACGPDFRISLDPNQRFRSIGDTLALAEALADYPIEVFEDPLPKDDLRAYAELRRHLSIPLALHMERPDDACAGHSPRGGRCL